MDLRRRLARLDRGTRRPSAAPPADPAVVARALGLEPLERAGATVWRRRRRRRLPLPGPLPDLHGFFARPPGRVARAEDLLLVDVETTGLAGGTGTLAFLAGLAWWEGADLVIEQVLLPGPGREAGLLSAVADAAAGRAAVVGYNAASYDLPLLRTRALLNRRPDPLAGPAVWDLVVPARRLWRHALPDCRQQTVEAMLAGGPRAADEVPGARIPAVWFAYLAGEGHAELAGVLRHNRRDMEGMARILAAVCAVARTLDPAAGPAASAWHDAWARGLVCERRGQHAWAAAWLRRALAASADPAAGTRLVADAVRLLKRTGDAAGALAAVRGALAAAPGEAWLHREAAILCEHRLGDLDAALAHARHAGDDRRVRRLRRRAAAAGDGKEAR